jgi:hypothetical protein
MDPEVELREFVSARGAALNGPSGNAVYAASDANLTQYRSRDLVHWQPVHVDGWFPPIPRPRTCPGKRGKDPVWLDDPTLRIGDEVYKLFHVSNRDARELELRVSHDDCHTWKPALR